MGESPAAQATPPPQKESPPWKYSLAVPKEHSEFPMAQSPPRRVWAASPVLPRPRRTVGASALCMRTAASAKWELRRGPLWVQACSAFCRDRWLWVCCRGCGGLGEGVPAGSGPGMLRAFLARCSAGQTKRNPKTEAKSVRVFRKPDDRSKPRSGWETQSSGVQSPLTAALLGIALLSHPDRTGVPLHH